MLVITTLLGNIPNCVPLFTDNMVYYEVAFGLSARHHPASAGTNPEQRSNDRLLE